MMDGRAEGTAGLDSRRDNSSERNWSRDSVLEALPSFVICLICSVRRSTCFLDASSSLSIVAIFCRCWPASKPAFSAPLSFSPIACSRMREVSRSPSNRIFSKRKSRSSACVASSAFTRCSRADFCACTRWNWTCRSSLEARRALSSLVACSARFTCACARSSWAERCSSCTSASSFARWRPELSSRSWETSATRASYSAALFMATMSTSNLTFSWRTDCSSWRKCSTSSEEAPPAGLHSSSPSRRAFSFFNSSISCRASSICSISCCRSCSCFALTCSFSA
mmetsp:Transcript_5407/g.17462  ORF Transcript_5407/g.17462 Transcript_5407/m.17462 type:complete len:282 (+) Transcript_5407:2-847(+)